MVLPVTLTGTMPSKTKIIFLKHTIISIHQFEKDISFQDPLIISKTLITLAIILGKATSLTR